jgi:hypothetical protein
MEYPGGTALNPRPASLNPRPASQGAA